MSNPGSRLPAIPNITGYPVIDTAIRNGIGYLAIAIAATAVTWLNAKGFSSPLLSTYLPIVIVTALVAGASYAWSLIAKHLTIAATVEHVLEAAQTGVVPPTVTAVASPAQKAVIAAVNAAQLKGSTP